MSGLCLNLKLQAYDILNTEHKAPGTYKITHEQMVQDVRDIDDYSLARMMGDWPKAVKSNWQGICSYPVPHPYKRSDVAYEWHYTNKVPMYDADTEYGRNRLELLDYVIEVTRV